MSVSFRIKEGYLGNCAKCTSDATHHEWLKFDSPMPVPEVLKGICEPIIGIWEPVCDAHCDLTRKHEDKSDSKSL